MMRFLGVANIGATPANIWIEFDNDTSKNVEAGNIYYLLYKLNHIKFILLM